MTTLVNNRGDNPRHHPILTRKPLRQELHARMTPLTSLSRYSSNAQYQPPPGPPPTSHYAPPPGPPPSHYYPPPGSYPSPAPSPYYGQHHTPTPPPQSSSPHQRSYHSKRALPYQYVTQAILTSFRPLAVMGSEPPAPPASGVAALWQGRPIQLPLSVFQLYRSA